MRDFFFVMNVRAVLVPVGLCNFLLFGITNLVVGYYSKNWSVSFDGTATMLS